MIGELRYRADPRPLQLVLEGKVVVAVVTGLEVVEVAGLLVGTTVQVLEGKACVLRIVAVAAAAAAAAAGGVEVEGEEGREIDERRDRKEAMAVEREAVNSERQPCHVNETERRQQEPEKELRSDAKQPAL